MHFSSHAGQNGPTAFCHVSVTISKQFTILYSAVCYLVPRKICELPVQRHNISSFLRAIHGKKTEREITIDLMSRLQSILAVMKKL